MIKETYTYWYWKSLISLQDRKTILNFIEKNYYDFEKEKLYDNRLKNVKDVKLIKWVSIKSLDVVRTVVDEMIGTNEQIFGYDLFSMKEKNPLYLNNYASSNKSRYDWHNDSSSNINTDVKLTGLINLSTSKYEGGEFEIFNSSTSGNYTVNEFSEGGDVILIKSNSYHRVMPVTKGNRKTLTIFFEGPRFR